MQLTRTHRVLIGVVVCGAVIIAGIGFAGSYAAVRELALQKGFGNFAYVFPIGIDAGICVLLALDLLLTWIRIPFPLLRQTAWLLTAATIAFNGAAAWPDPLGVGMHAVIPILFVVSVEAARHAIGRIADITADKHMEGVRLTRWLLSPGPTFLLWRRMKLWELRSYEQVIKLEQERLVYQASLRSRFGRAWRRKAPVESLMPLRLARYGVPLAETAPAGLAAAGIVEQPIEFTFAVERASVATPAEDPALEPAAGAEGEPVELSHEAPQTADQAPLRGAGQAPEVEQTDEAEGFAAAYQAWIANFQTAPSAAQFAYWLQDHGITTAAGGLLTDAQLQPLLQVLNQRYGPTSEPIAAQQQAGDELSWYDYFYYSWLAYAQEHGAYPDAAVLAAYVYERDQIAGPGGRPLTGEDLQAFVEDFQHREFTEQAPPTEDPADDMREQPGDELAPGNEETTESESVPAGAGAQPAKDQRGLRVSAAIDGPPPHEDASTEEAGGLTTVDRYYLAWAEHQAQRTEEPSSSTAEAAELSRYLAEEKGLRGRGGKPVSASNLRRYLLPFRIYHLWAEQRVRSQTPSLEAVAQECAAQGITAQHNRPITTAYIADQVDDFERRWQALTRHHAQNQQ
ncbi:DUF2637 domain-containing protein [Streptomyces sp. NBC_00124]|uniref:DUF2637 domain-containing protein n=1 Tax=Streptomyces sp. NBC_00124 TaxID=2975662 RepID=UPI00225AAB8C|nr:DUF2637 domain-containing protein [Streptomyces sp. NBC_00124]MCX5357261.1 DUF2637 domain-containing protein [Streptomyces sp. NBC_00124]